MLFRVLINNRWSPELPFPESPGLNGRFRWIELVPRPGSNEIALVALSEDLELWTSIWIESGWCTPVLLETEVVYAPGWRPFDAAWEKSGDILIAWGFNVFIEETRWAQHDHLTGTWITGQHPSTDAIGAHVDLASDPTSDRIVAVIGEGSLDNDVVVSVWNGTSWADHTVELTLASAPTATRALETEWIGDSGYAFALFRRQGHTGSFNLALFRPTGWKIQPDVVLPGVGKVLKAVAETVPGEDRVLVLVEDEFAKLFLLEYRLDRVNQTGTCSVVGSQALADLGPPDSGGLPFALAMRRN
jgi:hypothetical protein